MLLTTHRFVFLMRSNVLYTVLMATLSPLYHVDYLCVNIVYSADVILQLVDKNVTAY